MDMGKQIIFEERRKEKSKSVRIQFVESDRFNVLDDEGNLKYIGKIDPKNQEDDCTCMSFIQGNKDRYVNANGQAFQCKHIMKAKELRFKK